jgi:hypothetical protein
MGCDVALWNAEGADVGHVSLASTISCLDSGGC